MEDKLIYEPNPTDEELKIAQQIVALERAALDKWFKGDTSGYNELWSRDSFSYCDGAFTERIDDHKTIEDFLSKVQGKLFADSYKFCHPRVQIFGDTAILIYQLFADTTLIDMNYNCIEIFHKENDGKWRVVHSTWSFIRPMDKDWGKTHMVV